jgi:hypothetical protein
MFNTEEPSHSDPTLANPKKHPGRNIFVERMLVCGVCGVSVETRCSGCSVVGYCSAKHQKLHWKYHKTWCSKLTSGKRQFSAKQKAMFKSAIQFEYSKDYQILFQELYPWLRKALSAEQFDNLLSERVSEMKLEDSEIQLAVQGVVLYKSGAIQNARSLWKYSSSEVLRKCAEFLIQIQYAIPEDVMRYSIIGFLDAFELAKLSEVSRFFQRVSNHDSNWIKFVKQETWRLNYHYLPPESYLKGHLSAELKMIVGGALVLSGKKQEFGLLSMSRRYGPWERCLVCNVLTLCRLPMNMSRCLYHPKSTNHWSTIHDCCGRSASSPGCCQQLEHKFAEYHAM